MLIALCRNGLYDEVIKILEMGADYSIKNLVIITYRLKFNIHALILLIIRKGKMHCQCCQIAQAQ